MNGTSHKQRQNDWNSWLAFANGSSMYKISIVLRLIHGKIGALQWFYRLLSASLTFFGIFNHELCAIKRSAAIKRNKVLRTKHELRRQKKKNKGQLVQRQNHWIGMQTERKWQSIRNSEANKLLGAISFNN